MTKDFNVSVSMNQAAPVKTGVVLKQGDFGFDLKITVLDFTVTGTTPQIVFRKPMGAVESTDVTASGNVYTYTFKGTELDTPGKVFCDLKLKNSTTQRISTASFMFEVVADTLDGLTEESSSYSDTIAQLLGNTLQKSEIAGLVRNDGTINTEIEEMVSEHNTNLLNTMSGLSKAENSLNIISCLIGGDLLLQMEPTDKMYDSTGTERDNGYNGLMFYKIDSISGLTKILFHFEGINLPSYYHWFNQYDSNGVLLDYRTIEHNISTGNILVSLNNNCAFIKFSIFKQQTTIYQAHIADEHYRKYVDDNMGAIPYAGGVTTISADQSVDTSKIYFVDIPGNDLDRYTMIYNTLSNSWEYGRKLASLANAMTSDDLEDIEEQIIEVEGSANNIIGILGGDLDFITRSTKTMYNGAGTEIAEDASLSFYEVNGLQNINQICLHFEGPRTNDHHYFNQFGIDGTLLSCAVIDQNSAGDLITDILSNCASIKFSIWKTQTSFYAKSTIEKGVDDIRDDLTSLDLIVNGGEYVHTAIPVEHMIGTDGTEKTSSAQIPFYQINDLDDMSEIIITFQQPNQVSGVHWFNQYDSNGVLLDYTPFTERSTSPSINTINLLTGCSYIKLSVWSGNGQFSVSHTVQADVVKKSDFGSFEKVSGIGDSITAGYYPGGYVVNTYQRLIAKGLGASYQNLGISSTPVCPNSDYTGTENQNAFVYRYGNIANDADLIIIAGGTNDFRHNVPLGLETDTDSKYEETFYGACDYLLKNIIANHVTAKIVWISPFHQINDESANTAGIQLSSYIDAIKTKCRKYGTTFIDAFSCSGVNLSSAFVSAMLPDSLHPNAAGHELIYKNLMPYFAML